MSEFVDLETYGEGIGNATAVIRNNAARAGLNAPVPTCPGWSVTDLLAHQGMVHRWAAAMIRGVALPAVFDSLTEAEGRRSGDLLDWVDEGMVSLLNALAPGAQRAELTFFLPGAATPLAGWARRECHETTIHALDAMSACLGRAPRADELWFPSALAVDGIDELLMGFLPGPRTRLRYPRPARITVSPSDRPEGWTILTGPEHATASRGVDDDADLVVRGTTSRATKICLPPIER
ncbi:MAG: maleylpyruvate isomerase family mycothiol-dependent enzyme [Micropruina sp.]